MSPRKGSATESGKRDSNPRPQPWQGCALPTELFPQAAWSLASAQRSRNARRAPPALPAAPMLLALLRRRGSGGEGDRTPDLVNAIHALSQLSYAPAILSHPTELPAPDAVAARKPSRRVSERQADYLSFERHAEEEAARRDRTPALQASPRPFGRGVFRRPHDRRDPGGVS